MNAAMIERWNSQVHDGDTVWVLGDMFMGKRTETVPLALELNGDINLVPGNHDDCHPMSKKADRARAAFEEASITVHPPHIQLVVEGIHFEVSHFPYTGDKHDKDRYEEWRLPDKGSWLLCGHVHDAWIRRGRQLNVGFDAWGGTLVTEHEIARIVEDAFGEEVPHIPWE